MKKFGLKMIFGKDSSWTLFLALAALMFVVLACSGSKGDFKPVPTAFHGNWTSSDGSVTLNISADGTVVYRAGGTKIDNGAAELDENAKVLKLSLFGVSLKEFKIDQMPSNGSMKLDGVVYRTAGSTSNGDNGNKGPGDTDDPDMPSTSDLNDMVKDTLLAYNDGVQEEDFTEFRNNASQTFKDQLSAEKLKESFKEHIRLKKQIDPILSSISDKTPEYSPAPNVTSVNTAKQGTVKLLNVDGSYNTSDKTKFYLQYMQENGEWKLLKIRVVIGS